MTATHRFIPVVLLALLVVAAGCRTYGGRDTESITLDQIQQANQDFANALERAQADLKLLEQAAQTNASLDALVPTYEAVIALHEEKLAAHRAYAERLGSDADYRTLSRIYGTVISEHRLVNVRYQEVLARVQRAVQGTEAVAPPPPSESRYYAVPVFYQRVENEARQLTMRQALQGSG